MSDTLRELLYPLGFISGLMFGGRFLIQWLTSELHKKSVVPKSFWWLSLIGNLSLFLHAFIQQQFHVFVVQGCNAVISWRNLNLMQPPSKRVSFKTVILSLAATIVGCVLVFAMQSGEWFRIPSVAWIENPTQLSTLWHIMGFTGIILFASRFWVQWWQAEIRGVSYLGKPFWWLSLIGDIMMLAYFYTLGDPVNVIGPLFGLIPYIRNLMLLHKETA